MLEMVKSGGWLMVPLLLASVLALAIILERAWTLRSRRVAPPDLLADVWTQLQAGELKGEALRNLQAGSPLGALLAAGLVNARHGREMTKEAIENAATPVVHELERYLSLLGTIALISPLLGLLGTVVGIIDAFLVVTAGGIGDPTALAGGISKALVTTASGIAVAIPAMIMHRYYLRHIQTLTVSMEQQAVKLVDMLHGDREVDVREVDA
ncbi:biopolymer transporter ExbB [Amnimonas aquatica]|uniref:Biopolymer transporter ExbB n=2 Tax=Amnimonas aquatica TaxID=2094561 RepID=A0A2P6ASE2_9GAMM|nr:biopolymer transporter ExbB [Amnimonas aquatica]